MFLLRRRRMWPIALRTTPEGTLHFEHRPQRIVSLTYGTDEILTDLVDIKRIMAYSRWAGDSEISFITKEQAYTVGRKVPENTEAVYALQRPCCCFDCYLK